MITGTVVERWTGRPIPYVSLDINGIEVQTDSSGNFSVNLSGQLVIRVQKEGYRTGSANLLAVDGSHIIIEHTPILRAL